MHCGADLRKYKTYSREEQEVETEEAFKEAVQRYESEDYLEALRYLEKALNMNPDESTKELLKGILEA